MMHSKEFKVNNFDLLRLIAATQVIVDHYFQHLKLPISRFGIDLLYLFPGVPVFFIISGYLISASYERNNNIKVYVRNRLLRIYPGLWVCIIVSAIVIHITGVRMFNKQVLAWLPAQFLGLIYTPSFLKDYGFGSYNGSLWTIPIELQFYALLPLCYFLFKKQRFNVYLYCALLVFVVANIVTQVVPINERLSKLISYTFIPHFYLFLLGVLMQRLQLYKSPVIYSRAVYWLIGYIAFSLSLSGVIEPVTYTLIKNIILAFTILALAYTAPTLSKKLLRSNDISYGIYIYHGLILTVAVQLKLANNLNLLILVAASYLLAYLSWIGVEKPFLRRKSKTIHTLPKD
ncbi:acyltransferase family protein [Mucilaginibacter pallidiroseus]|nr:acyltransferase [Mucilaginibacter pallidiroseus]